MECLERQWFYADGQETYGPFPAEEMLRMAEEKQIAGETLVIAQGMTEWVIFSASPLQELLEDKRNEDIARQTVWGTKSFISSTAEKISEMAGEKGPVKLSLKDIFSEVFKKHTKEQSEQIFIAGTSYTTPEVKDISSEWPKPWLFFRIFMAFLLVYVLFFVCVTGFGSPFALAGLIIIGSFAVPFSLVIFFFETNVPQNISIFSIVQMFFVGGVAAIFVTLFLYSIVPINRITVIGAVGIGLIEEIGKLLIVAWFVNRMNVKFILNGLLIGAVIGAGFAAFESAGYALAYFSALQDDTFLHVIVDRAWTSIGSHTVWTAIAGAALVIVKRDRPFSASLLLTQPRFLKFFAVSVALHAAWDMPIFSSPVLKPVVLICIGWLFVFVLINSGLRQVTRMIRAKTGNSS